MVYIEFQNIYFAYYLFFLFVFDRFVQFQRKKKLNLIKNNRLRGHYCTIKYIWNCCLNSINEIYNFKFLAVSIVKKINEKNTNNLFFFWRNNFNFQTSQLICNKTNKESKNLPEH